MAHALRRTRLVTSLLLGISCASPRSEPAVPAAYRANWARPLPSDPAVRSGKFDNGFSYYLLQNAEGGRTELWLDVHAGWVDEAADQLGYATLLGQLTMGGLSSRPELQQFWRASGKDALNWKVGAGFDYTIYKLRLPNGDDAVLSQALDSLHLIASDPPLARADPEQVLQRWPTHIDEPGWLNALLPILLQGSHYAESVTSGGLTRGLRVAPDQLRSFHDAWYRPERMAVIAVGDFEPARMEAELRQRFAAQRTASPAPPDPTDVRPRDFGLQATLREEGTLKSPQIRVLDVVEHRALATKGQFRDAVAEALARQMLRDRLWRRFSGRATALTAKVSRRSLTRDFDVLECSLSVRPGTIEAALPLLFQELAQLQASGFTHEDRVRAQRVVVNVIERARRRQHYPNAELAEELQDSFETGEAIAGSRVDRFWIGAEQVLPTLSLTELNAALSLAQAPKRRVIDVSAPHAAELPSLGRVFALKAQAEAR